MWDPEKMVFYKYNTKAWMTCAIFEDWLAWLNQKIKLTKNRKVLLLLDNVSGHKTEKTYLHIQINFIPPNMTSAIQPCDAGIIKTFKVYYNKLLVKHYVRTIKEKCQIVPPDEKEAIYFIREAWDMVWRETITIFWRHCDIMPDQSF